MKKNPQKIRVRSNIPGNRRKSSRMPVMGLLRRLGSGMLKLFVVLSVLTVISLTFVMLYNYLLTSPYMRLEHVEFNGVGEEIKNELLQTCGLTSEQGLLGLKLESLKKKIEKHPWVRSAAVQRRFPDTLVIEVEKQEPVMLVLLDQFFYMNREGELFKAVLPFEEMDFPILTGLSKKDPDQEEKLDQTAQILNVLRGEEAPWSLQNLSEIHLAQNGGISLFFNNFQATIRISRQNPKRNMAELKQITKHLNESGKISLVTQIDLNHEDGAIVSFKKNQV